jgi:two-component system sensor histidine kinase VicK
MPRYKAIKLLFNGPIKLWLLCVLLFCLLSCKKKENSGEYSDEFKAVLKQVYRLNDQKKPDQAIEYLDSAFLRIPEPYITDYVRLYGLKYMYQHQITHNLKNELLYADSMLMMAKKGSSSDNYAEANFVMGDAYFDQSQYSEAYQCFYQGYLTGRNHLKHDILAEYTYRMGMVLFKQAHYLDAAKYFKESYQHGLFYKDNFRTFYQRQEVLDDIGECYKSNRNIDSASVYFAKTLNYININGGRFKNDQPLIEIARAVVYGNQGEIAMLKGQNTLAAGLFQKSISINNKKGYDVYNAELVSVNLGKLYLNTGQYQPLQLLYSTMRRQLDTVKNEEAETNWNWLMSRYYRQENDFTNAFAYLQQYNSLKDSITKRASNLKEINVLQQQTAYDKQYEIQQLENTNKLQLIYACCAFAFAIMALAIIFLVYKSWRKSKNDLRVFSELNKQINEQKNNLENTLGELRTSSQEKDRILRAVAHDLRNPIGGIASLTLVMADDDYTADQQEMINLIKETSNNSLDLINELLEVTNNGTTQLTKEWVEINSLLNKSVELLRFKAAEKWQKIRMELLAEPEEILISREKIWRVISNLISNAIKFSASGSTISVQITDEGQEVKIAVKDSGIGIPDNMKDKIFNMFTEAKRPGTDGEKSFGLGLSISKQIIESHNGKIWFENNGDKGTVFYVTLPKTATGKPATSKNQHTNARTI